jgi:hypothetical protein
MFAWYDLNEYDITVRKEYERRARHARLVKAAEHARPARKPFYVTARIWTGHQLVRWGRELRNRYGPPRERRSVCIESDVEWICDRPCPAAGGAA